ncbi:hypothetical protein SAMN05421678_10275 [Actinopolymorpha cephalotaxi]|uniref:Uncharacterized protein n=1 Tax=Actinopolymorpha cephalotaxi TaxID=504797 RepID=A0A1I2LC87_9ACTN|nr:hypothetical protein [Actinopolymorpha cephalotaxi]NYH84954.1 hypothetical protein [Actinopolymorpha cephalotaxi]SFF77012.1 hypothetical protein SAMN05421678_10275 [Actinopolymorpha cephalotaxi]
MLRKLHEVGIRSEHAYIAGFASIGLSVASWLVSNRKEHAGVDRADRWGIFVGEWAPTFFALGNGLRSYELGEEHEQARIPQQAGYEGHYERTGV